jgi:hypothetical protein
MRAKSTISMNLKRAIAMSALMASGTLASAAAPPSLPMAGGCTSSGRSTETTPENANANFPPVQLDMSTPVEPTAMQSGGRAHLFYELHLMNYGDTPLTLRGLDVTNADGGSAKTVAALAEQELGERLRPIGIDHLEGNSLGAGQSAVVFMCLAFDTNNQVPSALRHRVRLQDSVAEGPVIGSHGTKLQTLGRPVTGSDWFPADSPSLMSHHRTGLIVAGGRAQISRRYAIDWKILRQGASFAGDARDVHSYYAYGKDVLAVASGRVVFARDGLPNNIPRTPAGFETAVPITMDTVAGNSVVLDIGGGQFAWYAHLKPGSLRVKQGQRVHRGDVLAQIGNSGDAREPHLHLQVTTSPDILASEGLPYLIDHYRAKPADEEWEIRSREFPLGHITVDFGPP